MDQKEKAIQMHKEWNGKLETISKTPVKSSEDLAIAYTPGVAEPCRLIAEDPSLAYTYTIKSNTVAVLEILDPTRQCLSWKANVCCLKNLPM